MAGLLTYLITDSRRTVPTLAFYLPDDLAAAREIAMRDLRQNAHHEAIEISDGCELKMVVTRRDIEAEPAMNGDDA